MTNAKVTPEIENFIETITETNNQITIEQIKSKITENFNVYVCVETVRRCIYKLNITLKVAARTLENVSSTVSKDRRRVYASESLANDAHDENINIFIEASGFNLHLRRTMARSRLGAPVSIIVPSVRGRNVSLISAITKNEVIF